MNRKIDEQLLIKILTTIDIFVDSNNDAALYFYDWNRRMATIKLTKEEDYKITKLLTKYNKQIENIKIEWY